MTYSIRGRRSWSRRGNRGRARGNTAQWRRSSSKLASDGCAGRRRRAASASAPRRPRVYRSPSRRRRDHDRRCSESRSPFAASSRSRSDRRGRRDRGRSEPRAAYKGRRRDVSERRGGSHRRGQPRNAITYISHLTSQYQSSRVSNRSQGHRADADSASADDAYSDSAGAVVEVNEKQSEDGSEIEDVSECTDKPKESSDASEDETSGSYYTDESTEEPPPKPAGNKDIEHFDWVEGMLLKSRYKVIKLLGDGTFGRVLLAEDQKQCRKVAIKVIRDVDKYTRNAKREAEILKDIREAQEKKGGYNESGCVIMYDTFMHERRLFCLAFEPLGSSLYDILKGNKFRGYWMQDIQLMARQMLETLVFLHDELSLTHTDLKLENVLFQSTDAPCLSLFPREHMILDRPPHKDYVRMADPTIKLIDFGNATYDLEHHSSVINTRQYRAPEVILAMGWNEVSDLWSTGCILMELYTGELLFRTHDSLEHLALMEKIVESFPQTMFDSASPARKVQCLEKDHEGTGPWQLRWPPVFDPSSASAIVSDPDKIEKHASHVAGQRPLKDLVARQHRLFADFVASMLRPDPKSRPRAVELLRHPFLSERYKD